MNPAGSLTVSACFKEAALGGLEVRLERPPVTRLFTGQPAAAVAAIVPRLYALCARAQGAAAAAALAAAAGQPVPAAPAAALWEEALHEHLWRLLLDWPEALGLPPARREFMAWRAARGGGDFLAVTGGVVDGLLRGEWAQACRRRLPAAPAADGGAAVFPVLAPAAWLAHWRGDGGPAPARPASIAAAWEARLGEAIRAARALAAGQAYPLAAAGGEGLGVGQALTARGVLTHAVRLQAGRVAAYRLWAPTDGHFADAAGLAGLLAGGRWANIAAAEQALKQAILALDPCLPYTLKVDNA